MDANEPAGRPVERPANHGVHSKPPYGRHAGPVLKRGLALACALALLSAGGPRVSAEEVAAAGGSSSTPFVWSSNNVWGSARSYNIFSPDFPGEAEGLVVMPLAIQEVPELSKYVPEVAKSWKWQGRTFVMTIRPHMRWQNGRPVTTRDVVDSILLNGVVSNGVWSDITRVSAPNKSQVRCTLAPHVSQSLAQSVILGTYIVPAAQYGKYVTPGLGKTLATYYGLLNANSASAGSSRSGRAVTRALNRLEKFAPRKLIGDGPFRWTKWTTEAALLVKSPSFFDAKRIRVAQFESQEVPTTVNEGGLLGGVSTIDTAGLNYRIYDKYVQSAHHLVYYPLGYSEEVLTFNSRKYPLNMPKVRQAIAYILHRPALDKLVWGPNPYYKFPVRPALVYSDDQQRYLTASERQSLNTYPYSPTKAAQLLRAAGFKKAGGQWLMPNGRPFAVTLTVPSQYSDNVDAFKIFSNWLTSFGIKATESALAQATYENSITNGSFDLGFLSIGGAYPLQVIGSVLGSENFVAAGSPGLGFGPTADVPGLGRVNVHAAITQEEATVGQGKKMNKLVWDWARLINTQMPALPYADELEPMTVSTSAYVDWPPRNSPLWAFVGMNHSGGLAVLMQDGYIHPRS